MRNKLPNFLIVGAAKSGTSSLHNYLHQHPDIFLPTFKEGVNVKEPHFFVRDMVMKRIHSGVWKWNNYNKLFSSVDKEKAIGEASVFYLYYYEEAIKEIKRFLGSDIKIIIILRNPIDRAYSAYQHVSRSMKEVHSFEKAIELEEKRLKLDASLTPMVMYKQMGLYFSMVQAYMKSFKNVHIILFDDFKDNSDREMKKLFRFLNVKDSISVNTSNKYNVGGLAWKNKFLKAIILKNSGLKRTLKMILSKKIINFLYTNITFMFKVRADEMQEKTRQSLRKYYKNDINKLAELINQDLTKWLN